MKKTYSAPITEIEIAEPMHVVCASLEVNTHAEWGAEGKYAPEAWVNEGWGKNTISGFPTEVAGDEPGDWASRSNTGLFD
jgi:hypothetical protein